MPLTPEQQALREVAKAATPGPWHISDPSQQLHPVRAKDCIVADVGFSGSLDKDAKNAAYLAAANPAAILAILDQLDGCNEDYGCAVDSVAQLQDEVLEVRAQLEAALEAPAPLQFCFDGGPPMAVYTPPRLEQDWDSPAAPSVPAQTGTVDYGASLNAPYLAAERVAALSQPVQPDTDKLLAIIASAYQIAGAHDAPAHILDVLSDPEAATVEQVEAMLPYQAGRVVADWQLQKVREALETYYRALTIKQPSAAQPAAIYAIEQAMGMSWMGWLASLPVGAAPAELDERKE